MEKCRKSKPMHEKRLLIIVNEDKFFLSHRKEVGIAAKERGWNVAVVGKNTGEKDTIQDLGIEFIEMPVNPTGKKLHQEIRTLRFLHKLYGREKDAVIHHVGLKNMVWGGVAARLRKMDGVVNAVSGLGIIFSDFNPSKIRKMLIPVLKWGMNRGNIAVIFQNEEDRALFKQFHISDRSDIYYTKGSGVDLLQYTGVARSEDNKPLRVVFAGRMVKDKGVLDFIKAAEILRPKYEGKVEFILCGPLSTNPYAVRQEELERLCDGKYISWLGFRKDMPDIFSKSDIMCFPSYYREGVPKAVIDASAAGLPVITCESVGCKDTVEEGVNGFKVSPRSPEQLAEKLTILIEDEQLRHRMGSESRKIAERDYDVRNVVDVHLKIYEKALNQKKK